MLSSDVLTATIARLEPEHRFNMAMVSNKFCNLLKEWEDVKTLVLNDVSARVVGDRVSAKIEKSEEVLGQLFELCPFINRIRAECMLYDREVKVIEQAAPMLRELTLFNANFQVTSTSCLYPDFQCDFPQLRTLNVLSRFDFAHRTSTQLTLDSATKLFVPTLRELHLSGIALRTEVFKQIFLLTELRVLDLGGCVVDTLSAQEAAKFEKLENLRKLSLPPSLFSLHRPRPNSPNENPLFSLRGLRELTELTMHSETFDEGLFGWCLQKFFPPSLKELKLHGLTTLAPILSESAELNLRFKITMLRSEIIDMKGIRSIRFGGVSELIQGLYWCSPYQRRNAFVQRQGFHRRNSQTVTIGQWRFNLGELNAPLANIEKKVIHFPYVKPKSPILMTGREATPAPSQEVVTRELAVEATPPSSPQRTQDDLQTIETLTQKEEVLTAISNSSTKQDLSLHTALSQKSLTAAAVRSSVSTALLA